MVRLICPHCQAELEIDEAFRGSVCRCYTCGTLLSVPERRESRREARAERPESPTPTAVRSERDDGGDATDALAGAAGSPPAGSGGSTGSASPATPPPKPASASRAGAKRKPLSGRKKPTTSSRLVTLIAFVVSAGVLLAVLIFAVWMLEQKTPTEQTPEEARQEIFGEEQPNPYLEGGPQLLGVPLESRSVLILDASGAMSDYFPYVRQAAVMAVEAADERHALQIISAREGDVMVFPPDPLGGDELSAEAVERRLDAVLPGGGIALGAAMEPAIASEPTQILIVARYLPGVEEVQAMTEQVAEGTALAVIVIGGATAEADAVRVIEEAGGTAVRISGSQLRDWYETYRLQQRSSSESE